MRNHRAVLADSIIGVFDMDLMYIYGMNNHCLKHTWIALYNPNSKNFETVRGYLKISISVLHEEDENVDLTINTL